MKEKIRGNTVPVEELEHPLAVIGKNAIREAIMRKNTVKLCKSKKKAK